MFYIKTQKEYENNYSEFSGSNTFQKYVILIF